MSGCSPPAKAEDLADRRRRGSPQRHRQRHGRPLRPARATGRASGSAHSARSSYRWSGQVMEPVDFMPYSGRDGSDRIYVHSGDSGQGITNGVAGALNFIALYRNDKARFADLFDPARKPTSGLTPGRICEGPGPRGRQPRPNISAGRGRRASKRSSRAKARSFAAGLPSIAVYHGEDGQFIERARSAPMSAASSTGTASKNAGTARVTARSSCPMAAS